MGGDNASAGAPEWIPGVGQGDEPVAVVLAAAVDVLDRPIGVDVHRPSTHRVSSIRYALVGYTVRGVAVEGARASIESGSPFSVDRWRPSAVRRRPRTGGKIFTQ